MLYYRPVQYFTNHNRGVAPWSQGCVWEGVERRAGVEFLWTEILRAIAITIAESTANGAALVPTETRQSNHLAKMCHWKCECKARKAAELCVWGFSRLSLEEATCLNKQVIPTWLFCFDLTNTSELKTIWWTTRQAYIQKISLIYGIHTSTLSLGTSKIRFKAIPTC